MISVYTSQPYLRYEYNYGARPRCVTVLHNNGWLACVHWQLLHTHEYSTTLGPNAKKAGFRLFLVPDVAHTIIYQLRDNPGLVGFITQLISLYTACKRNGHRHCLISSWYHGHFLLSVYLRGQKPSVHTYLLKHDTSLFVWEHFAVGATLCDSTDPNIATYNYNNYTDAEFRAPT